MDFAVGGADGGDHGEQFIMLVRIGKTLLIIPGSYIPLIGEYPDLEKFHGLIFILIFFGVLDTCTCTHYLYIALANHLFVAHIILVFEVATGRNRNDFHIIVRVGAKAHSPGHGIIIQYAQGTEMNTVRIMVSGKTECMITVQPAMVCMSAGSGCMYNCFHDFSF